MSTIRGRAIMVGGMGGTGTPLGGAEARTDPNTLLTRPAYRITSGVFQPTPGRLDIGHPLLDLSSVGAWRLIAVAVAVAYVVGFHVTIGRARVGIGPGR
jgi:hypothetical protein